MRSRLTLLFLLFGAASSFAQAPTGDTLPDTQPLTLDEPLDVAMVKTINAFAEQEITLSRDRRAKLWNRDYSSPEAYEKSVEPNRERFRKCIGAVDELLPSETLARERVTTPENFKFDAPTVRVTEVLPGVTVQHLSERDIGTILVVPDSGQSPEELIGAIPSSDPAAGLIRGLKSQDIGVEILSVLSRDDTYSGSPEIRFTNQPHREFVYRPAFELGRHIIGYEVQKICSLVPATRGFGEKDNKVVWGIGDGAMLALYAAAIDPRIEICVVSGYFGEREGLWKEPIDRNVWRRLDEFGDADIASLIAPRRLIIEACSLPEWKGPAAPHDGRAGAAPGAIVNVPLESVRQEFQRAKIHFDRLGVGNNIQLIVSGSGGSGPPGSEAARVALRRAVNFHREVIGLQDILGGSDELNYEQSEEAQAALHQAINQRQKQQIDELQRHTQTLLHRSDKVREKLWSKADRSSLDAWLKTQEPYRDMVYDELIGRIPYELLPMNARSRKVIDEPTHIGYEVVLDVFASHADSDAEKARGSQPLGSTGANAPIIAGGILLVPKDVKPGEHRPCVVCQHGLEGTPMDTIDTDPSHPGYGPYKGFSTQLVKRGFIVYAPQNPYRGHDEFRVIQRKSNPLGRSLFSYIIPQHQQTLNFLAALPYVDADRIGFYGLSYGGKTAMRVPPMLPPRTTVVAGEGGSVTTKIPGYCLSICSADFNEWVLKNTSTEDKYSYVFTNEYEIFEWNMGHIANYAELAWLMTPRPFMVERGHDDGVAPDEWVAWEFAKVKRHYDKLGIGDRTEMEVFNGPHTINGKGTFDFLHRHLNWSKPAG
jgi:cephalosporin-C deacetylase-like acetyl esterase